MPPNAPKCWSCLKYVGANPVSLDGGATEHLCETCWAKLSVYQRVHLQLLSRSVDQGGLGLRDAVERFLKAIENAEDQNGPSLFPGRN